jgi:hypothetical protein
MRMERRYHVLGRAGALILTTRKLWHEGVNVIGRSGLWLRTHELGIQILLFSWILGFFDGREALSA